MNNYELYARTLANIESLEEELEEAKRHLKLSWNACKQDINTNFKSQITGTSYALKKITKKSEESAKLIKDELHLE